MGRFRLTELQVRPASRSDADAVLALLAEADVAAHGEPDIACATCSRAGMHVDRAHDLCVKVLRDGRELAARS